MASVQEERLLKKMIRNQQEELSFLRDMLWAFSQGGLLHSREDGVEISIRKEETTGASLMDGFLAELISEA